MWPRITFDMMKLFDLQMSDLLLRDPYYVRLNLRGPYRELGDTFFIGLLNAPEVVGFFGEVCPEDDEWLRVGLERVYPQDSEQVRLAEGRVLQRTWNFNMAKSPELWDALPWSYWDPSTIYDRIELRGKTVLDVGAGTGQVSLRCAPFADEVWALEPVARLRRYLERKMGACGFRNVRTIRGVLAALPLPDASVDAAILSNGSFGWSPEAELRELERVTRPGGAILLLAPCNFSHEETLAKIEAAGGYEPFEFEIPCEGEKPAFFKRL